MVARASRVHHVGYDRHTHSQPDHHRRGHLLAGGGGGIGARGEDGFTLGRRQLGHLHGDHAAHFGFPKPLWEELYAADRITYHPVFPDKKGWAARRIESHEDVRDVIAMLRLNYDRAVATHGLPETLAI